MSRLFLKIVCDPEAYLRSNYLLWKIFSQYPVVDGKGAEAKKLAQIRRWQAMLRNRGIDNLSKNGIRHVGSGGKGFQARLEPFRIKLCQISVRHETFTLLRSFSAEEGPKAI